MLTKTQQDVYQLVMDYPQALLLEGDARSATMTLKRTDGKFFTVRGRTVKALVGAGMFERVSGYTERVTRKGRTRLFLSTWYKAKGWV